MTHATWLDAAPDLTGRTLIVIGGSGGVGEGVTRGLLAAGATVIATGRRQARLDGLAARVDNPRLSVAVLDAMAPDLDDKVAALVAPHAPLAGAVVAMSSWGDQGQKAALAYTDDEFAGLIAGNITSQFRIYRALFAHIDLGGVLVHINGLSSEVPYPGSAGIAMGSAATKSLTRSIAAEMQQRGPRFYEVVMGVVGTRPRRLHTGYDDPRWVPSEDIGTFAAALATGETALAGRVTHYWNDPVAGPQATAPIG